MDLEDAPSVYSSATVEKDIREFFRAERKRLGLNQSDVANDGGVEQSTISKIERDEPYEPSVTIFIRAIRGLGMSPAEFFAKFETLKMSDRSGQKKTENTGLHSVPIPDNDLRVPKTRGGSLVVAPFPHDVNRDELRREIIHEIASTLFASTALAPRQDSKANGRARSIGKGGKPDR